MSPFNWGIIGICILLLLIFLRMPIGFVMALVGASGMCLIAGIKPAFSLIANEPYAVGSSYVYSVIPLFVFMGYLASHTKLSEDAFFTLNTYIGQFRGGLAMGTVGACTIFAAICGDPISTAATVATVSMREMRRYKYSDQLSLGTIAAGGNLGFLIPPSLVFIIYAILTAQSIGVLFMAGIVPGLLLALLFIITIYIVCRINPRLGPRGPKASWMERVKATPRLVPVLVVIVLVLGGIYTGIFTPTEAAAVGVFVMLLITLTNRQLTRQGFVLAIEEAALMTAMVFILIIGAMIFSRFLIVAEFPRGLAHFIAGLSMPPIYILISTLILYILIGCIMDILAVLIVAIPILHPLLVGLGFDPVWLAVLTCITVLIGCLTPPVGVVVFALSGMFKDVPMFVIFRGTYPFIGAMLVCLVILVVFPQITLWLPGMMKPG